MCGFLPPPLFSHFQKSNFLIMQILNTEINLRVYVMCICACLLNLQINCDGLRFIK